MGPNAGREVLGFCVWRPLRAQRLGLNLAAKLDSAKGFGLDLPSSPLRAQPLKERLFLVPLDAPQKGGW